MLTSNIVEIFKTVLGKLEEAQIAYMIVGSVASTIYGEPRLTRDLDLVIELAPNIADKFYKAFQAPEYYTPIAAMMAQEIAELRMVNILHNPSGMKFDIIFRKNDAHARTEFSRRQKLEILPGLHAYIATPEDIIIKKLKWYLDSDSEKHIRDIRGILARTSLDEKYLKTWIDTLNLHKAWELIV